MAGPVRLPIHIHLSATPSNSNQCLYSGRDTRPSTTCTSMFLFILPVANDGDPHLHPSSVQPHPLPVGRQACIVSFNDLGSLPRPRGRREDSQEGIVSLRHTFNLQNADSRSLPTQIASPLRTYQRCDWTQSSLPTKGPWFFLHNSPDPASSTFSSKNWGPETRVFVDHSSRESVRCRASDSGPFADCLSKLSTPWLT